MKQYARLTVQQHQTLQMWITSQHRALNDRPERVARTRVRMDITQRDPRIAKMASGPTTPRCYLAKNRRATTHLTLKNSMSSRVRVPRCPENLASSRVREVSHRPVPLRVKEGPGLTVRRVFQIV